MARKKPTQNQRAQMSRNERIVARHKPACGTFPGMGRARTFKDKKHHANKSACRGRVRED